MELRPRESVILATDFAALVAWYRDVLGFRVARLYEESYHYANLETPTGIQIGIAAAGEVGVEPGDRSNNTVLLQFEVDDVKVLLEHLQRSGGSVTFGPSFDEEHKFWYGGFSDPEGNPIWIVDKNCP